MEMTRMQVLLEKRRVLIPAVFVISFIAWILPASFWVEFCASLLVFMLSMLRLFALGSTVAACTGVVMGGLLAIYTVWSRTAHAPDALNQLDGTAALLGMAALFLAYVGSACLWLFGILRAVDTSKDLR